MVINLSIDGLLAWLKSKNWTAHSIALLAIAAAGIITEDADVRNLLIDLFKNHPAIVTQIVAVAGIVLKYSHSSSAAGTVANAESVLAAPNPPTQAAVQAAQTDPTLPASKPAQP